MSRETACIGKHVYHLCSHAWLDRKGTRHACGLEHGHLGVHECFNCNAVAENAIEVQA